MFVNKHFSNFTETSKAKNAKFLGYYFYMNTNIWGDFQICISVPLIYKAKNIHYPLLYHYLLDVY